MSFYCFLCNRIFEKKDEAIAHLKSVHQLKDGAQSIKCIVKSCGKSYLSFKSLKNHLILCEQNIPQLQEDLLPNLRDPIPENQATVMMKYFKLFVYFQIDNLICIFL